MVSLIYGIEKPQIFESLKSISSLYEVHVYSILANSTKRKLLIEHYNNNNELNDTIRGNLIDLLHANGSNNVPQYKLYTKFYNCIHALKNRGLKTNPVKKSSSSVSNNTFIKINDSFGKYI